MFSRKLSSGKYVYDHHRMIIEAEFFLYMLLFIHRDFPLLPNRQRLLLSSETISCCARPMMTLHWGAVCAITAQTKREDEFLCVHILSIDIQSILRRPLWPLFIAFLIHWTSLSSLRLSRSRCCFSRATQKFSTLKYFLCCCCCCLKEEFFYVSIAFAKNPSSSKQAAKKNLYWSENWISCHGIFSASAHCCRLSLSLLGL